MKRTIFSKNKQPDLISILVFAFFMLTIGLVSPVSAVSPGVVNIGVGTNGNYVVVNARLVDGLLKKYWKQSKTEFLWVSPLRLNSVKPIRYGWIAWSVPIRCGIESSLTPSKKRTGSQNSGKM